MPVIPVLPSDPRLEPYRAVSDAELLQGSGLFVAEGRLVVARVLASGRYQLESALMNDASVAALAPVFARTAPDVPLFRCETAAFHQITGFNIHRGCLALVRRPPRLTWREAVGSARLIVVLEGVTNADNVGGVFRNAAAFGAGAVLLSPTSCDPLYRKAIRTSMGAVLGVPFARLDPWPQQLEELREQSIIVAALTPREPAMPLAEFARAHRGQRVALLVGTEGEGLTGEAARTADVRVAIRMNPAVDSLNLSVATGIALHWLQSD
jgi:tRNA G18 (ribose-2'-O)-methylase SpoU